MRSTRLSLCALLLVLPLSLAACVGLGHKLQSPVLTVSRIEMIKGDLLQQDLKVHVHVRNPNAIALPVRAVSCEVDVAGERFAQGGSDGAFVVPARGEADFDVRVTANAAAAVLRILGGGARGGAVEYRMRGKVELQSALMRSLSFEQRGRVDLRQGLFTPAD
ncbi:MAG: hypothetical protein RLZZ393_299 [Pseudomonadota bacterium]|jgi:LEA14-like dessication related protein